jgi:putative heme iron utilization protein
MADTANEPTPAWQAIQLLRAARVGTLATVSDGQPFASLVTPGTAPDRSVLMLLSTLAVHTQHLKRDPRCSLLVAGSAESANPQTAPRFTVTGLAEPVEDDALKARWLAQHPYAALYAGFGDFALWRLAAKGAMLVGGFGRAYRLKLADITPDPAAVAAIEAAAPNILAHCNTDHPAALAAIAAAPGDWQMVAVDTDGCDLAQGDTVRRIPWASPVADSAAVRAELVRLAREARAKAS